MAVQEQGIAISPEAEQAHEKAEMMLNKVNQYLEQHPGAADKGEVLLLKQRLEASLRESSGKLSEYYTDNPTVEHYVEHHIKPQLTVSSAEQADITGANEHLAASRVTVDEAKDYINNELLIKDPAKATELGMRLNELRGPDKVEFARTILEQKLAVESAGQPVKNALAALGVEEMHAKFEAQAQAAQQAGEQQIAAGRAGAIRARELEAEQPFEQEAERAAQSEARMEAMMKEIETNRIKLEGTMRKEFDSLRQQFADNPKVLRSIDDQKTSNENWSQSQRGIVPTEGKTVEEMFAKEQRELDKRDLEFYKSDKMPTFRDVETLGKAGKFADSKLLQSTFDKAMEAERVGDSSGYKNAMLKIQKILGMEESDWYKKLSASAQEVLEQSRQQYHITGQEVPSGTKTPEDVL